MYSPAPGNRSFGNALNEYTGGLWQIQRVCSIAVDENTFDACPEWLLIQQKMPRCIRCRGKRQPFRTSGPAHDVADDPDDFAVQIKQGTTRVTRVNGRVGLQKLSRASVFVSAVHGTTSTDVTCC